VSGLKDVTAWYRVTAEPLVTAVHGVKPANDAFIVSRLALGVEVGREHC
jgi:hypothetical protein